MGSGGLLERPSRSSRRRTGSKPCLEFLEARWVLNYSIIGAFELDTRAPTPVANGLNNHGAIVGTQNPTGGEYSAVEFSHGKVVELLTSGNFSTAYGINDQGTIVGFAQIGTNPSGESAAVYVDRRGKVTPVATLSQGQYIGKPSINDRNEITGFTAPDGDDVLVEHGKQIDIGSLNGNGSIATDLSDSGEVVGYSVLSGTGIGNQVYHAFAYSKGKMTDLGTLGGTWSEAEGVNASGEIVGSSLNAAGDQVPFLYKHGKMVDIGSLGAQSGGIAARDQRPRRHRGYF